MLKRRVFILAVAVAAVLAGVYFVYHHWASPSGDEKPIAAMEQTGERELRFPPGAPQLAFVRVAEVAAFPEPLLDPLNGRVAYDENFTARISSPIAGRVLKIEVEPGDRVRAGQALVSIDAPEFASAISDVAKAEAEHRQKDLAYQRAKELLQGEVLARKEFEASEADLIQSAAERTRARQRLANLSRGTTTGGADRFTLRTPIAGMVADRRVNPGAEVRPDQPDPLFVITDPRHLWVLIDLPERFLGKIRPGQAVEVSVDAYPNQRFPGRIANIGVVLDPATRRVQVRCVLDNPDLLLKPEMFAQVTPLADTNARLPRVPNSALFTLGLFSFVFVETEPGVFLRRQVKLGLQGRDYSYIRGGLKEGERVVVQGATLLNSELTGN